MPSGRYWFSVCNAGYCKCVANANPFQSRLQIGVGEVLEYAHTVVTVHVSDMEVDGDPNRRVKICGSKGTIELPRLERFDGKPLSLDLRLKEATGVYIKGNHTIQFDVQHDRYEAQLLDFAKMVRGEIASPYTFEHDYLTQKVHLTASGYIK